MGKEADRSITGVHKPRGLIVFGAVVGEFHFTENVAFTRDGVEGGCDGDDGAEEFGYLATCGVDGGGFVAALLAVVVVIVVVVLVVVVQRASATAVLETADENVALFIVFKIKYILKFVWRTNGE